MAANATAVDNMSILSQLLTLRDPRTTDWVTVRDPTYVTIALLGYLYTVKVWGPRFMRDRKPYDLSLVLQCYNLFQVMANIYFCCRMAYVAYGRLGYSPFCQGLTYSTDADSTDLLNMLYYYLMVRVADFADTVFFVLRKKFSQITQLHVTHHMIVVFSGWQFMQFGADGQTLFGVCLNSTIHIMMYSYYFLAALGPHMKPYLWWKKYLTTIQIGQFVAIIAHALIPVFVNCGYPRLLLLLAIPQVSLILGMFINFYIQSYLKINQSRAHQVTTQNAEPVQQDAKKHE